jgi:hypothetical protein
MALKRLKDRIQQVLLAQRFGEECHGTRPHSPHRHRNIAIT